MEGLTNCALFISKVFGIEFRKFTDKLLHTACLNMLRSLHREKRLVLCRACLFSCKTRATPQRKTHINRGSKSLLGFMCVLERFRLFIAIFLCA